MSISQIKDQIDFLLEEAVNSENSLDTAISYRYVAKNYRIRAKLPIGEDDKVVLNNLSMYPDIDIKIAAENISEKYGNKLITRKTFFDLKEWSYMYGSTGRPVDDMVAPDFGDPIDEKDEIIIHLNDRIKTRENLTVNDCYLALSITGRICDEYGYKELDQDIFSSDEYNQVIELLDESKSFIDMKRDGRLDWDMMASTFRHISDQTHQDIMRDAGEKSVIRELKEFDGDSIQRFLEQKDT